VAQTLTGIVMFCSQKKFSQDEEMLGQRDQEGRTKCTPSPA
jgi:hypothetical protein